MIRVPLDKAFHFLAGWAVAATLQIAPVVSLGAVLLAASGKELWDWHSKRGTPEFADWVVTVLGGVGGLLASDLARSIL